jgi:hypothetical protein
MDVSPSTFLELNHPADAKRDEPYAGNQIDRMAFLLFGNLLG